jgi:hypothetical protein
MLNQLCTMTAKSAPSRFFGKKAGTQPPHIAGPLAQISGWTSIKIDLL